MINNILTHSIEILIGFAGGLAVGGGFVGFLTVLAIIPRLTQLSKSDKLLKTHSACVILGTLFGAFLSFTNIHVNFSIGLLIFWGVLHGIFNGMLIAALTEILNVFPLLSKRIGMDQYLLWFFMAIVFGKIAGSLFQWTIFVR